MIYKKPAQHITAKILSILFASVLWFHVATKAEYTYKVAVPVKYLEPSQGFMVAAPVPGTVLVYVRGSAWKLFPYMFKRVWGRDESFVTVSLNGLAKGRFLITVDNRNVFIPISAGLTPDDIYTNVTIPVLIDKKIRRTVPVDRDSLPRFDVEKSCVLVGKPKPKPDSVTAEGPEEIVASLAKVRVKKLAKHEISESDTLVHAVLDTDSLRFVTIKPESIAVYFPVEPLKVKLLCGMRVVLKNFPKKVRKHVEPDTVSVSLLGPESIVSRVQRDDIFVTISYKMYLDETAHGDSLLEPLIFYPEGITHIATIPKVLRVVP